ncbi:hypothetical protein OAG04_00310 [bacterium]|nr:hypothetical protein [bacterium]
MNRKEIESSLILLEIMRGYSRFTYNKKNYFFKHFRVYDSLKLVEFELDAFDSAIDSGIKSEEDLIKNGIKLNFWSEEEESSIKNLKWMISKSEAASSKIVDKNSRKAFDESIDKQRAELKELEDRRSSLVGHSAENLASRRKINEEVHRNLFKDEDLTIHVDKDDLHFLIPFIYDEMNKFSDQNNMLRAAFNSSFFDSYSLMSENPFQLFKSSIFEISIWQKNLLFYSSVLLAKLKNHDVPDDVREDPLKLYNFSPKDNDNSDNKVTHGVSDLRAKMAEKGGKLTAEDF